MLQTLVWDVGFHVKNADEIRLMKIFSQHASFCFVCPWNVVSDLISSAIGHELLTTRPTLAHHTCKFCTLFKVTRHEMISAELSIEVMFSVFPIGEFLNFCHRSGYQCVLFKERC
jgi:hypothetical protein